MILKSKVQLEKNPDQNENSKDNNSAVEDYLNF